jgi:hypothetical protein
MNHPIPNHLLNKRVFLLVCLIDTDLVNPHAFFGRRFAHLQMLETSSVNR